MSKRERETKDDDGGGEKRMKIDNDPEILNALETLKKMKENLKKMKENLKKIKEYLHREFEKKMPVKNKKGGETYLHFAAFMGYIEAANALIQDDADVNAVDKLERTALHIAAGEGHVEFAKVLIENRADLDAHVG